MADTGRVKRTDAGTVRVSDRDVSTLRVIGETGGARLSFLQRLLAAGNQPAPTGQVRPVGPGPGRSDSAARAWVGRMVRGGYLRQAQLLRATWVTVTPAGARLVGLVDDHGQATPRVIEAATQVDHTNTVGLLRLHLQAEHPDAGWLPEREFWVRQRERKGQGWRRPDGALDFGDRLVGVEVELTRKHPDDYRKLVGLTYPKLAEVWWYTPPALEGWLRHALAAGVAKWEAESRKQATPREVRPLPEGVWS